MSADFSPGKLLHERRLFFAGSQIGMRQHPPFSNSTTRMEVEDEAIAGQITVGAEQAQNIRANSSASVNDGE
ncbi:hypothetical protein Dimus_031965, partial [Dionaea muscipula]